MKFNLKQIVFGVLALTGMLLIGAGSVQAQSKSVYVGTNGTVYSGYHGAGEMHCNNCDETDEVYCYQCRTFHKSKDYEYLDNRRESCGHGSCCGKEHASCGAHECGTCEYEMRPDLYNMYHDYDHEGGDYMVKYRGNKVKVKCASCGAKWKYYYDDYHSNHHYVYDRNEKVIVSYEN